MFNTPMGVRVLGIPLVELKVYDTLILNKKSFKIKSLSVFNNGSLEGKLVVTAGKNCAIEFENDKGVKDFIIKSIVSLDDNSMAKNEPINFSGEPEKRYVTFCKKI